MFAQDSTPVVDDVNDDEVTTALVAVVLVFAPVVLDDALDVVDVAFDDVEAVVADVVAAVVVVVVVGGKSAVVMYPVGGAFGSPQVPFPE